MTSSSTLESKMTAYYTAYYHDALGLPDWQARVQARLQEERLEEQRFRKLEARLGALSGKRFLNVGCGTGGMNMVAADHGMASFGIEVSQEALDICHEKARRRSLPLENFISSPGEQLPFESSFFDVVYCLSVLEHVQDVRQTIHEMVRVLRPGGTLFIDIPNYLSFTENHYKIPWLPKFPKPLARRYLRWLGRPDGFLDTINYTTPAQIKACLKGLPVLIDQERRRPMERISLKEKLKEFLYVLLGIESGEFWITKR